MNKHRWLMALFFVWIGVILTTVISKAAELNQVYLPLAVKLWPVMSTRPPTPIAGRVLFSEVMADPPGTQPDQEWFELYNDGGTAFNLTGYWVGDEEDPNGSEGLLQFPAGTSLASGQVMVIARKATAFVELYGFAPDFEIDETDPWVPNLFKCASGCRTNIELTNGGDELLFYDPAGDVVDALAWGSSTWQEFQPTIKSAPKGCTLERYPAYQDTDSAADWRSQSVSNPGQVNVQPPTPTPVPSPTTDPLITVSPTITPMPFGGQLLISEVLADPSGNEPGDEWIELYNPASTSYALLGFKLGDEETPGGSEGMYAFPSGASIAAGQVIVIANQASLFYAVYGFLPNYELIETRGDVPNLSKYSAWGTGSISLVNMGDEVLLLDATDRVVDEMAYGNSEYPNFQPPVSAAPESASLERFPPGSDTDTASDWRIQLVPAPGQLDFSPTPTPTVLPPLVINEIHADPHASDGDANGDGVVDTTDDEFIEIVNTTENAIDLSGWTLYDGLQLRHTFAISTLLPMDCSVVVFGGGSLPGLYGGSLVYTATGQTLALNNAGDTITLYNPSATPVISYTYGSEAGDDQAITRSPDIVGLFVKHTLPAPANGRRFSPGTRLDGVAFAGCGGMAQKYPRRLDRLPWLSLLGGMVISGWYWWRKR